MRLFPAFNSFHYSPQPAALVLTPCLQSHQPSRLHLSLLVVAAAAVAAAAVAAAAQDLVSALERLMDSIQTHPTRTTSIIATREKPMFSTVLPGWCLITVASAATGLK